MPVLTLDTAARLAISKAILESTDERKAVRIIPLSDGGQLLMQAHFGHVCFSLFSRQADLFENLIDVSELVRKDMEANRDWVRS